MFTLAAKVIQISRVASTSEHRHDFPISSQGKHQLKQNSEQNCIVLSYRRGIDIVSNVAIKKISILNCNL